MLEWINWGEAEIAQTDTKEYSHIIYSILIKYNIIYFAFAVGIFYYLFTYDETNINNINNIISIISLALAIYAIQTSKKDLAEMQADYWNARGVDHNNKADELRKQHDNDWATLAYESAIDAFDRALTINPRFTKAWSNKGNALLALKSYDRAIEAFDRAIELDSQSPRTWNNRGRANHEIAKTLSDWQYALATCDKAIRDFDEAIVLNPNLDRVWNNRGAALKEQGDILKSRGNCTCRERYEQAIDCYIKAIELNKIFSSYHNSVAVALDTLGDHNAAIIEYDRAIELDPKNATYWHAKGNALKELGVYCMALRSYDRAIDLDRFNITALDRKGDLLAEMGNHLVKIGDQDGAACLFIKAVHSYDMAIKINPNSKSLVDKRINVLRALGITDEAKDGP